MCLAESVAGDSAVAHATAFARAVEKLARREVPAALECERAAALELERMAMQIADTGALCMDVGYQLGQVASEALRTMTINTTQAWCGNRFGKGLIRPLGTDHPLTAEKAFTLAVRWCAVWAVGGDLPSLINFLKTPLAALLRSLHSGVPFDIMPQMNALILSVLAALAIISWSVFLYRPRKARSLVLQLLPWCFLFIRMAVPLTQLPRP